MYQTIKKQKHTRKLRTCQKAKIYSPYQLLDLSFLTSSDEEGDKSQHHSYNLYQRSKLQVLTG